VVPQARRPVANVFPRLPTIAALQVPMLPNILMTTDVGAAGVFDDQSSHPNGYRSTFQIRTTIWRFDEIDLS
jgi:hypothetical protein